MFAAESLSVIRADRLLFEAVSFSLAPGAALLLKGRNGAGKSTLLRVLAGLRRPDHGDTNWNNVNILQDREAHAARIGWLSHHDAIKPALTARENLLFPARVQGGDIDTALQRMGLADLSDLPARMLSAGQKRRLALARAMLGDRPLWLLDEPLNGLDTPSITLLTAALAAHRSRGGIVIAATHQGQPLPGAALLQLAPE